jgi:hypothetical protein
MNGYVLSQQIRSSVVEVVSLVEIPGGRVEDGLNDVVGLGTERFETHEGQCAPVKRSLRLCWNAQNVLHC